MQKCPEKDVFAMDGDNAFNRLNRLLALQQFFFFFFFFISNYIFIVKVNGIANVTATTIIAKYCDFDNFVELHKP
jgi:hypothetical protein